MEVHRRLMNADPADAACDISLTGQFMGQLRTSNNRRNRAIRQTAARTRAVTTEVSAASPTKAVKTAAKPTRTAS